MTESLTMFQKEICLYQELLDCLEAETMALVDAQEELILEAAARKELLLDRLLKVKKDQASGAEPPATDEDRNCLASLQRQVAVTNARNRDLAAASLEVVQEFLAKFHHPGPGLYHPAGQAKSAPEAALFRRQA